jgi:hypothetical protein
MNINEYLQFLNDQYGVPPAKPVQNPQAGRTPSIKRLQPKTPQQPNNPISPQDKVKSKPYDYLVFTNKILKQGEIFRKKCYAIKCEAFESTNKIICKDKCDIQTCQQIIKTLKSSIGKCNNIPNQKLCRQRYVQLISAYQQKLSIILKKGK